jgi:hypothetical protein
MVPAVSVRPLTAEAGVRSEVNQCGICGGKSSTGTRLRPSTSFPPASIIPPIFHSRSFIRPSPKIYRFSN